MLWLVVWWQYFRHPHDVSAVKKKHIVFCFPYAWNTIQSWVHIRALFYVVFSSPDSPVLTSRVAVKVHVLDINEFPPELASPYETFVCENAKMGQVRSHLLSFLPLSVHPSSARGVECRKFSSVKTCWFFCELTTVDWSVVCPPIELIQPQGDCWKLSKGVKLNLKDVDLYKRWQRVIVYT